MHEMISDYMRVGIVHFMAFPNTMHGEGPILETVREIAKDPFFEAIELTWIKDTQTRLRVSQDLKTAKMSIAYGGQPRLLTTKMNINDLDESSRLAALNNLKNGIDEAYEIGAESFAFLSGPYNEADLQPVLDALQKSTNELCSYSRKKGNMPVVLEIFDYDIDKKSLIGPAIRAKEFAEKIKESNDNFGLMIDLSHIPMIHESIKEHISPIKEHIVHAHMGNTVISDPNKAAYGDMHPRFGFPNSENDVRELAEYLHELLEIGFLNKKNRPIVSFEVKPWEDEEPAMVIANAKRTLNRAWALL